MTHCLNCGSAAVHQRQRYCAHCGQPSPVPRIDWRLLAQEFGHTVLNMDRGLFFTVRALMLRPGRLIADYLDGRRAGHVRPLWLLMVTAAVVVFLTRYLPDAQSPVGEFNPADWGGEAASMAALAAFQTISDGVQRHFAVVTLLLLPLEALIFRLAFWRVKGLNYPEWLTITAFLTAQVFVIWACFLLVGHWFPAAQAATLWVILAYRVLALLQAFPAEPWWAVLIRGLLGGGAYLLANLVLMAAATWLLAAQAGGLSASG